MKFELRYTEKAWSDLQHISKTNARKIVKKLGFFIKTPDPMKQAKALKGIYNGLYRFRIGDYRAIFGKNSKGQLTILTIIRIGHRKDVY